MTNPDLTLSPEMIAAIDLWAVKRINKGKAKRRLFGVKGFTRWFNSENGSGISLTDVEMRSWIVLRGVSINPKTDKCNAYPIFRRTA